VNQGAHVDQPPEAGGDGQGRGMRRVWASLTGPMGAVAAWRRKDALLRHLPPLPAWLPRALPSRGATYDWLRAAAPSLRRYLHLMVPYLRLALRAAAAGAAILVVAVLALAVAYRWINPPVSTLMLGQSIAGTSIERRWVPLDQVSPHLIRAVVLSEDGGFCRHSGVDWRALREAIAGDRGGSTITMQVVKNLFLWPSRSYVRKSIEIALAYLVDALWPKRRILEIYLNIAEWGDGVFGAEAAARTHFGKSAARLTPKEAALMAVALPNPAERTPGLPSAGISRLAGRLMLRMATSRASLACVRAGLRRQPPRQAPKPRPKPEPQAPWDYLFPAPN
jgi:monofunctional biosynthetic peptidoglycan transglycosylase